MSRRKSFGGKFCKFASKIGETDYSCLNTTGLVEIAFDETHLKGTSSTLTMCLCVNLSTHCLVSKSLIFNFQRNILRDIL